VELWNSDIFYETSVPSQYQANPRLIHFKAAYHIFAHIKSQKDIKRFAYDFCRPIVDESFFNLVEKWSDFYYEVEKELPSNMPKSLRRAVHVSAFVDANHARNFLHANQIRKYYFF